MRGDYFFAVRYEGGKFFLRKYAVKHLPDHDAAVTSVEPVPINHNAPKALSASAARMLSHVSHVWYIRFILTHTRHAEVSHLGLSSNPMKDG